jgi:hypothetical protein
MPGKLWPLTKFTKPVLAMLNAVPLMERAVALPLGNRVRVLRMALYDRQ